MESDVDDLDQLTDRAVETFNDEYRKHFPRGGDEQDHDDAVQAAVEAVVMLVREGAVPHLEAVPPGWWQAKAEQAERERDEAREIAVQAAALRGELVSAREELRQERERVERVLSAEKRALKAREEWVSDMERLAGEHVRRALAERDEYCRAFGELPKPINKQGGTP